MAVVNPMLTPMFNPNVKDSRWLTLEVCREFQRTKCSRTENECKFAHPPPHVEVQNGRVTCCFDSIKGKCQRKEPPCKYLHPPQHLREQLLQNGRNNLILKNLQMQYIAAGLQPTMIPQVFPTQADQSQGPNSASPEYRASPNPTYYTYEQVPPYIVSQNAAAAFGGGQYGLPAGVGGPGAGAAASTMPTMLSSVDASVAAAAAAAAAAGSVGTPTSMAGTKLSRPDRLEVCREYERASCTRSSVECRFAHPPDNVAVDSSDNTVTVCMDFIKGKCSRDSCRYFHPPPHLQAQIKLSHQRANAAAAAAAATPSPQLPPVVEVLNLGSPASQPAPAAHTSTAAGAMGGSSSVSAQAAIAIANAHAAAHAAKKRSRDPADDFLALQNNMGGLAGMVPVMKRPALGDKSGMPMYQPSAAAASQAMYHQAALLQLQQQPFVPVSTAFREQPIIQGTYSPYVAGHPSGMPRL